MNRRKKTLAYLIGLAVIVYCGVQVMYMKDVYSPLQVLADAHSEAKRLMRFITAYHFMCNNTLTLSNTTSWPICIEQDGGINMDTSLPKVIYSIGPSNYDFEEAIARNISCNVYIFSHEKPPLDFFMTKSNYTHFIRSAIVPNDPSDFSRNSYETQTLNNALAILKHKSVDILKIEHVLDPSRSYDLLYYLIKDGIMKKVSQVYFSVLIDKIDDDYLYAWYRTLYNLFHKANFRLYHTATSNQLCLQVTLMESCLYYMSWIKSPSPRAFIMYPPAVDGTYENEMKRLEGYLDNKNSQCKEVNHVSISDKTILDLCMDVMKLRKPCKLVIIKESRSPITVQFKDQVSCDVFVIQGSELGMEGDVTVFRTNNGGNFVTNVQTLSLNEAMFRYLKADSYNFLYTDIDKEFWELLSIILDTAVLQGVDQMISDLSLWEEISHLNIRQRFSELKRLNAYGLELHQYFDLQESERLYFTSLKHKKQRLSYIRMTQSLKLK
ncbi:uncharacterized protein LOC133182961 [Saccostrea echinata]|uniref:uncharacterized protein LOC133182961 n=1 Tax=Saccostrea echinata TaxID=191078 RepID=UPI002A7FDD63|nr:uncharacterized protein LOC133182961 [Saccostrea echinata]XP_061173842.1 uncharacterized protein LOC133182961 [Saccostrea echinata]